MIETKVAAHYRVQGPSVTAIYQECSILQVWPIMYLVKWIIYLLKCCIRQTRFHDLVMTILIRDTCIWGMPIPLDSRNNCNNVLMLYQSPRESPPHKRICNNYILLMFLHVNIVKQATWNKLRSKQERKYLLRGNMNWVAFRFWKEQWRYSTGYAARNCDICCI